MMISQSKRYNIIPILCLSAWFLFLSCVLVVSASSAAAQIKWGANACPIEKESPWCSISRGGDDNDNDVALVNAENVIINFLDEASDDGGGKSKFYIQGWRWHTMSLLRDCRRLEKLALRMKQNEEVMNDDDKEEIEQMEERPLNKAVYHVVDFNMKGLHRIETDLFFTWLRQKLTTVTNETSSSSSSGSSNDGDNSNNRNTNGSNGLIIDKDVAKAFSVVIDHMETVQQSISQYGIAMKEQAKIASKTSISESKRSYALDGVAQLSASMSSKTRSLLELEEKVIVPAIALLVSDSEQKSFNNKVIRKLGLFDSRVHLVGMYDAVWEHDDKSERDKFQEAIPYIPRLMLPRWRTNLYEPQAGILAD